MEPKLKTLTDYIISLGAAEVNHTEKTYLAHAIGVYNDMKAWNGTPELCRAALFHSIYGTQGFQGFTLPLERQPELRALIGAAAVLDAAELATRSAGAFRADNLKAAALARPAQKRSPSSKLRRRTPARSSPTASRLSSASPGRTATSTFC